jgi:hypothetical protein
MGLQVSAQEIGLYVFWKKKLIYFNYEKQIL